LIDEICGRAKERAEEIRSLPGTSALFGALTAGGPKQMRILTGRGALKCTVVVRDDSAWVDAEMSGGQHDVYPMNGSYPAKFVVPEGACITAGDYTPDELATTLTEQDPEYRYAWDDVQKRFIRTPR
jgi:hypothetical protein